MNLPDVVSQEEWQAAQDEFLAKDKELTRARDALAAERRRLPMVRIEKDYVFHGPDGEMSLIDLFEGRSQLIVYHFYFTPESEQPCGGCTMFVDNMGHPAHLRARDTTFSVVSLAELDDIEAYRKRMGWEIPWYSSFGSDFNVDFGVDQYFALSVFLRDGDDVYRTYVTGSRGVEALGSVWTFLDLTPFGRQEEWEDTPEGRPQSPPYTWWRRHDEYDD